MSFSPDLYVKALNFAARAHGSQLTPINLPYVVHVTSVCMELIRALEAEPSRDGDLAVPCALLHDVLEDTETLARRRRARLRPPGGRGHRRAEQA